MAHVAERPEAKRQHLPDLPSTTLQEILKHYKPRASVVPAQLDFTDCPYMWPFCRQPLYAGAMPLMFNATVLNGMGLIGEPCQATCYAPFTYSALFRSTWLMTHLTRCAYA